MPENVWLVWGEMTWNDGKPRPDVVADAFHKMLEGHPDHGNLLEICNSLEEVRGSRFDGQNDHMGYVYVYDKTDDGELINQRFAGLVVDIKQTPGKRSSGGGDDEPWGAGKKDKP